MALTGIVVAGIALVFFAWTGRDVAALQPTFGDHWHLPYGIYDCTIEDFIDPLEDPQTPNAGIHTHGDGVIHVHPYASTATGSRAQLDQFLLSVRSEIENDEAMTFTDRDELAEGVQCGGEDAILQVARFAPGETTASEVITENLVDFRFQEDQEGVVIALAPEGAEIPPPPDYAVAGASAASPQILGTDGLQNFDGSDTVGNIGFDEDGVLIGPDGPVLDADGEPVTRESLEAQTEAEAADADAEADEDEG